MSSREETKVTNMHEKMHEFPNVRVAWTM